jgi:ubiquinone/menaquinone biosynthesis C-methylase UbiE
MVNEYRWHGPRDREGRGMDRATWLAERKAAVVATYDDLAAGYDRDEYPTTSHARFVARLLETCPDGGVVLDAPCGTGRYFTQVAASGRRVIGVDQSPGMLREAERRGVAERLVQADLQHLDLDGVADASMTIDAMENIPPEDWPRVLAVLRRAVRAGGHHYLTIEVIDEDAIDDAFADLSRRGLPAVRGEVIEGDVAGYHFYPSKEQIDRWLDDAGLVIEDETYDQETDDWGYRHLLLRQR